MILVVYIQYNVLNHDTKMVVKYKGLISLEMKDMFRSDQTSLDNKIY